MRSWYNDHLTNPYPTDEEKHMIMRETGLTLEQVSKVLVTPGAICKVLTVTIRSPIGSSIADEDTGLR